MIGYLRGRVLRRRPPQLLLDVNGLGYEVEAPMSTFYNLPDTDQPVEIHTHLVVREDAQVLYGFLREQERDLFRLLLKVNGVGGKVALAILSSMTVDEFGGAVQNGDSAALTRVPGIGKKTAERVLIELRDRIEMPATAAVGSPPSAPVANVPAPDSEAVSALIALGYRPPEASRMVRGIDIEGMGTEDIIRAALKAVS